MTDTQRTLYNAVFAGVDTLAMAGDWGITLRCVACIKLDIHDEDDIIRVVADEDCIGQRHIT